MGFDYYIACKSCQMFVNLGWWRVFPNLQFPHASKELFPGAGNVAAASISSVSLRERLCAMDDPLSLTYKGEPDFQKLVNILTEFCGVHDGHELYFINDSGDFPWSACDRCPWYEWEEVIGPNTNVESVDLPKNLIRDLHFKSWNDVEKHLQKSHFYNPEVFPGGIDIVKNGFEKVQKK